MRKDPTQRFSSRVQYYIRYRPGYPREIIDLLRETSRLTPQSVVVDVGSGTGALARLFLEAGNWVFGIEPNPEMRQAFHWFDPHAAHQEFRPIVREAGWIVTKMAKSIFATQSRCFYGREPRDPDHPQPQTAQDG